jgi:Carboxypeptidase regulatory-like domain
VVFLYFVLAAFTAAQEPNGTIEGVVRDQQGGFIPGALIVATNKSTKKASTQTTNEHGRYLIQSLPAGAYEVKVSLLGFQTIVRDPVVVETGVRTAAANFDMVVGEVSAEITVDGLSPLLLDDSAAVGGTLRREFIEGLPLNGQNAVQLANMGSPGVREGRRSFNRSFVDFDGAILGGIGALSRQTTDGISTMAIGNGGSVMDSPLDAVQEARVSSVNWDLSVGLTMTGVYSAVTRSGGNDFHGSASYFFRGHNLSAYPALARDPANPDPFFKGLRLT